VARSIRIKLIAIVFLALTVTGCQKPIPSAETLNVQPTRQALPASPSLVLAVQAFQPGIVQFTVTTNLPTPLAAMASLDLQGLKPNDSAVGTSHNIILDQPITTVTLKAVNDDNGLDGKALPNGRYDAEVTIGPKWDENKSIASLSGNLVAKQSIEFKSGRSQRAVKRMGELQGWVMENVPADAPWNEARFVAHLGHYEKAHSDLSSFQDAYYFPDADMTLIVNRVQGRVSIWRPGRATR
jgi:hypothetical protein